MSAPTRPPICGRAPGAQPEQDRDHDEHDRERVEQVGCPIVAQAP